MNRNGGDECEIELSWLRLGPNEWVAELIESRTGMRREARTGAELREALRALCAGTRRSTAVGLEPR